MSSKTGVTYKSIDSSKQPVLPTKNGYVQFVIRPITLDHNWIAINNVSVKE